MKWIQEFTLVQIRDDKSSNQLTQHHYFKIQKHCKSCVCIPVDLLRSTEIANILQEIITHNKKKQICCTWQARRSETIIPVPPLMESFLLCWVTTVSCLVSFESLPGLVCLLYSLITCQTTIKKFQQRYVTAFNYVAVMLSWCGKESLIVINVPKNVE